MNPARSKYSLFTLSLPSSGSVFILALWTLFFLGALALAVGALVSANINLASGLRSRMVARELARAGVEVAIQEVFGDNSSNWNDIAWIDNVPSNEDLFKENDSLESGVFSVTYTYYDEDQVVTNYGVFCESQKASINGNTRGLIPVLEKWTSLRGERAEELALKIVACRQPKSDNAGLTGGGNSSYAEYHCYGGKFRVLFEMLLLEEFRSCPELFSQLEPHLTVYGEDSFSGTSTGLALASKGFKWDPKRTVLAESRIDFVVNKDGEIEYWHEH